MSKMSKCRSVTNDDNKSKNKMRIFQDISNTIHKRTVSLTDFVKHKKDCKPKFDEDFIKRPISIINDEDDCLFEDVPSLLKEINSKLDRGGNVLDRSSHGASIIKYLKIRDDGCYLRKGIKGWHNSEARYVLVDWLIKVATHRKTCQRTIHLAIIILDRCVFLNPMDLARLQLLGLTCYLLACKYEEILSPSLNRLEILTEKAYNKQNFIDMEIYILTTLDFDLGTPTPIPFLNRFLMAHDHSNKVIHMTRYIVDLLIYSKSSVKYSSAIKAASSLYVARAISLNNGERPDFDVYEQFPCSSWTKDLETLSSYSIKDMRFLIEIICKHLILSSTSGFDAVRIHYSSSTYFKVSLLPEMNKNTFLEKHPSTLFS